MNVHTVDIAGTQYPLEDTDARANIQEVSETVSQAEQSAKDYADSRVNNLDSLLSNRIAGKFRLIRNAVYWGTAAGVSRPTLDIGTSLSAGQIGYYNAVSFLCINHTGTNVFLVSLTRGDSGVGVSAVQLAGTALYSSVSVETVGAALHIKLTRSGTAAEIMSVYALQDNTLLSVTAS